MASLPNRRPSRRLRTGALPGSAAARRRSAARNAPREGGLDWARRTELFSVLVASLVAVGGLWYTSIQTQQTAEEAREDRTLSKSGQVTDRYTKAVENLAHKKEEVRLGSIYALQRIMEDSPRDQPTIVNVLAAYLRTHADKRPAKGDSSPADVQAAFTVVTTRDLRHDAVATRDLRRDADWYFRLDLRDVWIVNHQGGGRPPGGGAGQLPPPGVTVELAGADLTSAHLLGLDLSGARMRHALLADSELTNTLLDDADLRDAFLDSVNLRRASLLGADLRDAQLGGADLRETSWDEANLRNANLALADLSGADFGEADLDGADLYKADLRKANMGSVRLSAKQRKESTGG